MQSLFESHEVVQESPKPSGDARYIVNRLLLWLILVPLLIGLAIVLLR